jgi:acyl-CoA thioesterase-1
MIRFLVLFVFLCNAGAALAARTVLVFGDSLSAGYGIAVEQSWPALLNDQFAADGLPWNVANASISGETTAGGRSRLPAALAHFTPSVVVIALGANDGLRGLPVPQMRDNLVAMVQAAHKAHAQVLLVGIKLPPNYGPDYTARFEEAYRSVARRERTALLPFLLEPIALDAAAFQADNLHPVAAAQPKLRDHVWKALKPLLK